ncbi:hypothetical protein SHI21_02140 [Bacteriovorax sp. PP10]|uniref:Uncharacterized protein n=1 Tax=Bacteriovorax antarcticus TaxID=3088717 RepID=A0ABU5VPL6_9BACT|nr:hypothetical protein [Bacteriovorax sp. PP10]MEA9354979.1 hypothetical protein [Bacteriovorax sp. PP10]
MNNAIYKDHLLYLSLIAVLVWIGGCFTGSVMSYTEWGVQLKVLAVPILLINSYIIYFLILNFFQNKFISFSTAFLYLASSSHVDVFVYRIQFQVLLAEMFILLFFYSYQANKWWRALSFLLIGILLNTKLIFLSFLLLRNKKVSLMQKALSMSASLIIFLYVSPLFFKQPMFLLSQFKTIPLMFKNLIVPLNFTLLNIATITPFLNKVDVSMFAIILIACLFALKKNEIARIVFSFLLVSLVGSFVPFKQIYETEASFYYYLPSFYPLILLSFLLSIAFLMSKLEGKKNINKAIVIFIGLYWVGSTVLIQKNFQNIVNEWTYSIGFLPENYNDEEVLKLKYAEILVSNEKFESAKEFINKQKSKFPNERWYRLLVSIAAQNGDMVEVERIYKELSKSQTPLVNEEFED